MTNTETAKDADRIRAMITVVDRGDLLEADQFYDYLETFEQYECWEPYFRLILNHLDKGPSQKAANYIRIARVQNIYLEDTRSCAATCVDMVEDLDLDYKTFHHDFLPALIEYEDFRAEAMILAAVNDAFNRKEDIVACLERLCYLYEKKTHNEMMLAETYEKLLEIDPHNIKALRYFKLVYTQANEWEEVVDKLKTLLECVTRPQEVYRVAQELAAIYLYQLDYPREAIDVLERYCVESHLDSSTILYDAYQRLEDWRGCLRVLRECLLNIDGDNSRSILHYKIGHLHDHLQETDEAFNNYCRSFELGKDFLDPAEHIVTILLDREDWEGVAHWVDQIKQRVFDRELQQQLDQAKKRLLDGIKHAQ